MKIGIDGYPLTIPYPCGIKNYAENLIGNLAQIDRKNEYIIFSSAKVAVPRKKNFKSVVFPKRLPILNRQLSLPVLVKKYNIDIFHNLEPYGPIFLRHPGIVTTVHDVNLGYTYPWLSSNFLLRLYDEVLRWFTVKNSKKFITDTESVKKEFLTKYRLSPDSVKAIYLGVDKNFKFPPNKKQLQAKYFLALGDFAPRKNIKQLITAYSILPVEIRNKFRLILVSSTPEAAEKFRNISAGLSVGNRNLSIIVNPSYSELAGLYSGATAFIYPSLYEGFGLPILEAMACGTPVITSNYGATAEIAEKAALLTDPENPEKLASSLVRIITEKKLRNIFIKNGFIRVKQFSWNKTATETVKIYKNVFKLNDN